MASSKHLGCCLSFEKLKNTRLAACVSQVSQHPACLDQAIQTLKQYHQRRCLEAWHVNSAHAPLNRDDGGLFSNAYLHLIYRWCHHSRSSIKVTRYSAKITPDEDIRTECRNVGSWIVTSLGYVHKNILRTRVAYYVWSFTWLPWTCILQFLASFITKWRELDMADFHISWKNFMNQ